MMKLMKSRSVEAFVDIIKNIDFRGVSGRINFPGRSSRLSDIDIIQWFKNGSQEFLTDVNVGVYKPNYTRYILLQIDIIGIIDMLLRYPVKWQMRV